MSEEMEYSPGTNEVPATALRNGARIPGQASSKPDSTRAAANATNDARTQGMAKAYEALTELLSHQNPRIRIEAARAILERR